MPDALYPQERAILFDYFRMRRPRELKALEVQAPDEYDDDLEVAVLVEPDAFGEPSSNGLANAVARLLLARAQNRLPQWTATRVDGKVLAGRKHRRPKTHRVDLLPQLLFGITWADRGPGFSWPEVYHLSYVPGFERFVVTASQDSDDLHGYTDLAIGSFREGTDVIESAKRPILKWWRDQRRDGQPAWEEVISAGLVQKRQARDWKRQVWGKAAEHFEEA